MNRRVGATQFDNTYDGLRYARAKALDGRGLHAAPCDLDARTVRQWGAQWLERRERSGIRSIKDDRSRWRHHVAEFAPWADSPIESVTRAAAREWLSVLSGRRSANFTKRVAAAPLAAQTLRNVLNLVRACFAEALEDERITSNPFAGLRIARSRSARTSEGSTVLLPHEVPIGLAALPESLRLVAAFALGTGLRQGEQWNLRLADLTLDGPFPCAVVRYGSKDGPTKSGKVRTVFLFGMALDAARAWVAQLATFAPVNPLGLVFPTPAGKVRHRRSYGWSRLGLAVGRHVRWHDLRHTCGTSLAAGWWGRDWSLEEIRVQFGHSSVKVTERYAQLAAELAQRAAAAMLPAKGLTETAVVAVSTETRGDSMTTDETRETPASPEGGTEPVCKTGICGFKSHLHLPAPDGAPVSAPPDEAGAAVARELAAAAERTRTRLGGAAVAPVLVRDASGAVERTRERLAQASLDEAGHELASLAGDNAPAEGNGDDTQDAATVGRAGDAVPGGEGGRAAGLGVPASDEASGASKRAGGRGPSDRAGDERGRVEQRSPEPGPSPARADEDHRAAHALSSRLLDAMMLAGHGQRFDVTILSEASRELRRFADCWWEGEHRTREAMSDRDAWMARATKLETSLEELQLKSHEMRFSIEAGNAARDKMAAELAGERERAGTWRDAWAKSTEQRSPKPEAFDVASKGETIKVNGWSIEIQKGDTRDDIGAAVIEMLSMPGERYVREDGSRVPEPEYTPSARMRRWMQDSPTSPLEREAAREYLDAASGDMPQPWSDVATMLLAEYRREAEHRIAAEVQRSPQPEATDYKRNPGEVAPPEGGPAGLTKAAGISSRTLGNAPLVFAVGDRVRLAKKVACLAPVGAVGAIVQEWPATKTTPAHFHVDDLVGPDGVTYPGIVVDASVLDITPDTPTAAKQADVLSQLAEVARAQREHRATSPDPKARLEDAFRATELGRAVFRDRETVPSLEFDEDEEDSGNATPRGLLKSRVQLQAELDAAHARLRAAVGLLSDVDRVGAQIATFLDVEVKL